MTDPNALQTQRNETIHLGLNTGVATMTAQWLLHNSKTRKIHQGNHLEWYVCGEEGFRQIAADIEAAKESIDLVCWGFDPGMALVRSASDSKYPWAGGEPYGELLKRKAQSGVKVRLLVWYDAVASAKQNNLVGYVVPGIPGAATARLGPDALARRQRTTQEFCQQHQAQYNPLGAMFGQDPYAHARASDLRDDYCVDWWRQATSGNIANLEVRCRKGQEAKVKPSVADEKYPPSSAAGHRGINEQNLIEQYATHHQKPVLIDYAYQDGQNAVGYVMGLNSVTDYWDTAEHAFDEAQREPDYYGTIDVVGENAVKAKTTVSRKPLRDYAARIQGEALMEVYDNFATAWNQAEALPLLIGGGYKPQAPGVPKPQEGLKPSKLKKDKKGVNLQVLRTQPEYSYQDCKTGSDALVPHPFEKSIKHAYFQASSFARNYLYLENQYFFYEEWAEHVQANRVVFMDWIDKAGRNSADAKLLHLFAVIPEPEDAGMVPRTYDTLKALGQGEAMQNQRELIDEQHGRDQPEWVRSGTQQMKDAWEASLGSGELAKDSAKIKEPTVNDKGVLMLDGKDMGLKTLVVKLVTKNQSGRKNPGGFRDIYIHSKLMMTDDSFTTLGSANMNLRSMAADSEINIATDDRAKTAELRKRVWGNLTGGQYDGGTAMPSDVNNAFKKWKTLAKSNKEAMFSKLKAGGFKGFIVQFEDKRAVNYRYG